MITNGVQMTKTWRRALGVACAAIAALGVSARAQTPSSGSTSDGLESRAALEAEAANAEAQHRTGEALLLRSRLQRGDFQDGDRIVVKLTGSAALVPNLIPNDTIILRANKVLQLPQMADLSLDGVLRSELTAKVSSHLARYVHDSSVQVTPLIRLAVLGQVRLPNFYYTTVDVLLSDMLMKAGGPAGNSDWLGNVVIRRGTETIWNASDTRTAMTDGISLERLSLRTGDEIYVDEQKTGFNWTTLFQYLGPFVGLVYALRQILYR
ncbi:hypothetical protein BH09GEM1_BH09GEM1_01610 [soil metagenome]